MKLKPAFVASVLISLALFLFARFGISAYAQLFVFTFEQIEAAWIVGAGIFAIVKVVQSAPLCYRLGLVRAISYEWLAFAAIVATGLDIAVTLTAWSWVEGESIKLLNIIVSIGSIGWAGLVRLMVLQWLPDRPLVIPPFVQIVESEPLRTYQSQPTNLNPFTSPQNVTRTVVEPQSVGSEVDARSMPSVLDLITKTPASTLAIAQPGTGKTMTSSAMGRRWVNSGHHVYYIDSKMDEKEVNLWDDACSERYQFDGTLLENPDDECVRLIEAFEKFEAFRLRHLGDGMQTICILDELPAVMGVFKTYKPNPNAALNFINRIVNRLPSRNCHILLIAQNPSCTDTLPTGTLGTLKKIVLTKAGGEAELQEWKGLTVIKPIDLSGVSSAIRNSPVGRGCYYSVVQKWLSMENLYREGVDYCRDTLSGGGDWKRIENPENGQNAGVNAAAAPTQWVSATATTASVNADVPSALTRELLTTLVLEYFAAADKRIPKSIKNMRDGARIRDSKATVEQVSAVLGDLLQSKDLILTDSGYVSPLWQSEDDRGN